MSNQSEMCYSIAYQYLVNGDGATRLNNVSGAITPHLMAVQHTILSG